MSDNNTIHSFKGMDKNMKCRGFQYEAGKTYETDTAKACESGFHACEAPLDVLRYYPPTDGNRYFEVEQDGEIDRNGEDSEDSKVASTKLTVGAEIGIPGLVKAHVEWVKKNIKEDDKSENTGNRSAATNTGDYSAAEVSGKNSIAIATGFCGKARASLGSAIVLVERNSCYAITAVKAVIIDGETYKPDTWYTLKDGKIVEVE